MKPVQILVTMLEDTANPNLRGGPRGHNYRGSISFRYIWCTVLTATFKFCAIFTIGSDPVCYLLCVSIQLRRILSFQQIISVDRDPSQSQWRSQVTDDARALHAFGVGPGEGGGACSPSKFFHLT